jgi:hypothetical protein
MAYTLTYSGNQTGGNRQVTVPDGSIYSIGNIQLPGRNFNGYGSPVDQNMLSIIENFASQTSGPAQPVTGQIWYDVANVSLKYNSSSNTVPVWQSIPTSDPNANVTLGNVTIAGDLTMDPGTIIYTTGMSTGGSGTAGTITGTWTLSAGSTLQSTYADLAERHHSDTSYPTGTVVKVGGQNEITQASVGDKVLGVVSADYAYLMNSTAGTDETHPAIAYVGRVPVRIIGPINKHDVIVPTFNGCARSTNSSEGFGWALETNLDENEKLVLCIIK